MSRARPLALVLVLLVTAVTVPSPSVAATSRHALGTRLVNRFFQDLERRDVPGLRRLLSPAFQIQRADGSRLTKAQYLRNFPAVLSHKLRHFVVTGRGDVLVATYEAKTTLMRNGHHVTSGFAPRISVFVRGKRWRLVAHGNFNPP
jgi:ketosteroid isomerase-like protein